MTDEASPKPKKKKQRKRPLVSMPMASSNVESPPAAQKLPLSTDAASYAEGKKWAAAAAVLLLVGIGLVATGEMNVGPFATVAGMATAIWGAHRLGRSGPDGAGA